MASAAGALTAPRVQLMPADYPQDALRRDASAAAMVMVVVAPNGRAARCETGEIVGDQKLGHTICGSILRNRHRAARLRDGTPTWGVAIELMRFFVPGGPMSNFVGGAASAPLAELTVNRLPGNARGGVVRVNLLIDETGKAADCGPASTEKAKALVQTACSNFPLLNGGRVTDQSGAPVSYVIDYKLKLVPEGKPASAP